jgi:hypothetical protein
MRYVPRSEEKWSMAWSPTPASPALCSASKAGELARAGLETLQEDGPLSGGTANRGLVIRVGDTVQRPTAPCWPATHALLAHMSWSTDADGAE